MAYPSLEAFDKQYVLDTSNKDTVLGKGGFSTVYKCTQRADTTEFACKVAEYKNDSEHRALVREADICGILNHTNIVRFYGLFEGVAKVHMVFEIVSGGELFDAIVKKSHFSEKEASNAILDILEAVKACHDKDIIHRDLKPENLLLTGHGHFKLTDFGLAKVTKETAFHGFCGTPAYMAPEMVVKAPYNCLVDIWACGVILYILLVGYQPFWSDNREELFAQINSGMVDFPPEEWSSVSASAKDLVRSMLERNVEKRFNVDQCLSHPWVADAQGNAKVDHRGETIVALKKFNARRKLKSTMKAVRASVHMQHMVDHHGESLTETKEELVRTNEQLLNAIIARDWATYVTLVDPHLTCFEPEAPGVLVSGLDFHKFYFDLPEVQAAVKPRTTLLDQQVRMLGGDVALMTYVRMTQAVTKAGAPYTAKSEETRIWKRVAGSWRCTHFHRSGAPSAPAK